MKPGTTDEALKGLYGELRRAEQAGAPAFDRVLARERGHEVLRPVFSWGRLAAAALVLVAIGTVVLMGLKARPAVPVPASWVSLSEWQPSTDGLLSSGLASWSGAVTAPSDSWLDEGTFGSETITGEGKESL